MIFKKREIKEATSWYDDIKNEKPIALENPEECFNALVRLQNEINNRKKEQWRLRKLK